MEVLTAMKVFSPRQGGVMMFLRAPVMCGLDLEVIQHPAAATGALFIRVAAPYPLASRP